LSIDDQEFFEFVVAVEILFENGIEFSIEEFSGDVFFHGLYLLLLDYIHIIHPMSAKVVNKILKDCN
jgi:hypothetical protein